MKKHFVVFDSPGTFFYETSEVAIDSWDVEKAKGLARGITERYGAKPFRFKFVTMGREDDELDSYQIAKSCFYYLGGVIRTLEEVKAENNPDEHILRGNMESNGWNRVITNTNSWKTTQYLNDDDIVLDWVKEEVKP